MSARKDETPMFPEAAHALPISKIHAPPVDPRRTKVSAVHKRIREGVKSGDIYRPKS